MARRRIAPKRAALIALVTSAVIIGANTARADEPTTPPPPTATNGAADESAMQAWRRIRALPPDRIDDTLGFMIDEAGDMGRLISTIESMENDSSPDSNDPQLRLALLRCLYLSASIDGDVPNSLMETVDRVLESQAAPFVRAEAAHRLQIATLSRVAAERDWSAPLLPEEIERLMSFLACHGASPRAISSIKRLADDANLLRRPRDLDACRDWVSASVNHHPLARAIDGDRQRLAAIGTIWSPPLRTIGGTMIDWASYRGAPVAVAFVGTGQSPSEAVLTQLREHLAGAASPPFHLVVVSVQLRDAFAPPDSNRFGVGRDAVTLNRGWREPLLIEFGIRALPTIFLLDDAGRLRHVVRPSDWRVGDETIEAIAKMTESEKNLATAATSNPAMIDTPTTSPSGE